MMRCVLIFFALLLAATATTTAGAQQNVDSSLMPKDLRKEEPPQGVREMLSKMQVERQKKDYDEMLDRGKQVLALAKELESGAASSAALSSEDRGKLTSIEKLTKKIVGELGADDDDLEALDKTDIAKTRSDAFKQLSDCAEMMLDELQKTSRFTVSLDAIEASGTVLKVARAIRSMK